MLVRGQKKRGRQKKKRGLLSLLLLLLLLVLFFVLLSLCVVVKCALTALLRIVLFSAAFAADAVVQLLFVLLLLFVCQIDFCCSCYFCVSFWMWARLRACGRACLCVCAQGKAGPRACARGVRMCGGALSPCARARTCGAGACGAGAVFAGSCPRLGIAAMGASAPRQLPACRDELGDHFASTS